MSKSDKKIIIIGYSGHSFEIIETILSTNSRILGYTEINDVKSNPFNINFLGNEMIDLSDNDFNINNFFICIGDSKKRKILDEYIISKNGNFINVINSNSFISSKIKIGYGNFVAKNASINSNSIIGNQNIINTSSVIEHDCIINNYCHVGPNSTILGGVEIDSGSFIGANTVIKEGIKIGKNVIIGAGSVVLKDIPDFSIAYGNPSEVKK